MTLHSDMPAGDWNIEKLFLPCITIVIVIVKEESRAHTAQ